MAEHMTAVTAEQLRRRFERIADKLDKLPTSNDKTEHALDDLATEVRLLAARISGMAAGWQPIETADTTGTLQHGWMICETVLLLMSDGTKSTGRYNTLMGKWVVDSGGAAFDAWHPTHWMPLPAAMEPPHV